MFLFSKDLLMCLQQAADYAIKSLYVKKFVDGKNNSKTPLELEKKRKACNTHSILETALAAQRLHWGSPREADRDSKRNIGIRVVSDHSAIGADNI